MIAASALTLTAVGIGGFYYHLGYFKKMVFK